ncbi:MAG: hypothetical protein IJU64_06145 [Bacilli bacterium]|nr:hypothetical protein [Bacilli bacterium]
MEPLVQIQTHGCGFTSVKALLLHLSKNPDFAYLPEPKCEEAPPLKRILAYGSEYGLKLKGFAALDIKSAFPKDYCPCLVMLRRPQGPHMALLLKAGFLLRLYDPERGIIYLTRREFAKTWSGVYMRLQPPTYLLTPPEVKIRERPFLPLLAISSALPSISLVLGLVFLEKGGLGYGFLGLALLLLFGNRILLFFASRCLNEQAFPRLRGCGDRKEVYAAFQSYKGSFLSLPLKAGSILGMIASLLYVGSGASFLLLRDMGCFFVGCFLLELYRQRKIERDAPAFASLERDYYQSGHEDKLRLLLKRQEGIGAFFARIGLWSWLLLGAVLCSLLLEIELPFPVALLHLFLFFPLREVAASSQNLPSQIKEYRRAKARFYTPLYEEGFSN